MARTQARPVLRPSRPDQETQEEAVRTLLRGIGVDPTRHDLQETPARFVKAFQEMTSGYADDAAAILGTVFDEPYDGPVRVQGIPFWSLCEHHLLPFHGTVDIEYVPDNKVVGLSKLSRLVHCFSRRLQMQERMTRELADAISLHLLARGVRVRVRGHHSCMAARGARSPATMETLAERGCCRTAAAPG